MSIKNTYQDYGMVSKLLHLLIAIAVICMLSVGFFMDDIGIKAVYLIHKFTGLCILTLAILMIFWKSINPKPAYPITMPRWQQILAKSVQHSLLLLIILMPLSGWIFSTAAGKPPVFFGTQLPMPFIPLSHNIKEFFAETHKIIAWIIIGFVSIHVLGAMKHWFIDKDGIVQRMLCFCRR